MDTDRDEFDRELSLKEAFGNFVVLNMEEGEVPYRIMAELELEHGHYAVLQSEAMRREGDIEILRIVSVHQGQFDLETVESDEEWERVAEAYDDLQFGSDEQP